jgi:hypothetical protein
MSVTQQAAGKMRAHSGRGARRAIAVLLAASLGFAGAARAETFVLVYAEGSVVTLPGGLIVSRGEQIDGGKLIQLGPADKAIFISQSGNVARHNGPFCGSVAEPTDQGDKPAEPPPAGCQK